MAVRSVVVALVLGLVGVGCGDPLGDGLKAERPDEEGPAKVVDEDGDLVDAPPTTAPTTTTTTITTTLAPGQTAPPTTAPAATTTTAPGVVAKAAWVESVMTICREEDAGLSITEAPTDPAGFVDHVRAVAAAYTAWADRVEVLPILDRRTEANLVEGLRRLRRSVDMLGPAVDAALSGDVDRAWEAWWMWGQSMSGASTALYAAGVPVGCWA